MRLRLAFPLPLIVAAAMLAGCTAGHRATGQTTSRATNAPAPSSVSAPASGQSSSSAAKAASITDGPMTPQQVVKAVTPSVVRISVSGGNSTGPTSIRGSQQQGAGTGVIVDDQGHILTNNHVVTLETNNVAGKIQVALSDGRTLDAKVVGRDPGTDLAVLQVSAQNLTPAKLSEPGSSEVGEPVLAIGYALNLQGTPTVTSGVISAVDRVIPESTTSISGAIQTDAPINPGNSGGPLVNLAGEVVGINTAGIANTQGIFWAISSDVARPILKDLVANGKINRGFIGIQTHTASPEEIKSQNASVNAGVTVDGVQSGTPADKAGLKSGDIIVKVGNHDIHNTGDLQQSLIDEPPGTKVTITFYRGSDKKTLDVTLGTRPDNLG